MIIRLGFEVKRMRCTSSNSVLILSQINNLSPLNSRGGSSGAQVMNDEYVAVAH